jgi:hypothetical protein
MMKKNPERLRVKAASSLNLLGELDTKEPSVLGITSAAWYLAKVIIGVEFIFSIFFSFSSSYLG